MTKEVEIDWDEIRKKLNTLRRLGDDIHEAQVYGWSSVDRLREEAEEVRVSLVEMIMEGVEAIEREEYRDR